ncbi:hypothetical protein FA014_02700 [Cellulomonas hominis]|uniref:Uncharacterized protein n=1 Tax=Cellulomonas hominis TaxID=156981 RepID=A0A7Z8NRT0_9CELL|nr:hypothetical protein [Cellulomonas hominis]TKR26999.1 hypothetical protein FA014_02700 [Cellulomonas hominis]
MAQRSLRVNQSPDLPDVLLHMTRRWGTPSPGLQEDIQRLDAIQRLASVLHQRRLRWGMPFDTTWPVVSFTQTTRRALRGLSSRYDQVGLAFDKQRVWDDGGGPVHYVRGDEWDAWRTAPIPEPMRSRGVRLWPGWDGAITPENFLSGEVRGSSEWLHEREWRIPKIVGGDDWGWPFGAADVRFLILAAPWRREKLLEQVAEWKGDVDWVASLPVAFVSEDSATFVGAEDLWP